MKICRRKFCRLLFGSSLSDRAKIFIPDVFTRSVLTLLGSERPKLRVKPVIFPLVKTIKPEGAELSLCVSNRFVCQIHDNGCVLSVYIPKDRCQKVIPSGRILQRLTNVVMDVVSTMYEYLMQYGTLAHEDQDCPESLT